MGSMIYSWHRSNFYRNVSTLFAVIVLKKPLERWLRTRVKVISWSVRNMDAIRYQLSKRSKIFLKVINLQNMSSLITIDVLHKTRIFSSALHVTAKKYLIPKTLPRTNWRVQFVKRVPAPNVSKNFTVNHPVAIIKIKS